MRAILALALLMPTTVLSVFTIELATKYHLRNLDTIVGLENCIVQLRQADRALTRRLDELQRWRAIITVASRAGWDDANRYIMQFPLDEVHGADSFR